MTHPDACPVCGSPTESADDAPGGGLVQLHPCRCVVDARAAPTTRAGEGFDAAFTADGSEVTIFPRDCRPMDLLSEWITADSRGTVNLEECR